MKSKTPKRVSISTKINGQIAREMRDKSPRASLHKDIKKERDKYKTRKSYQINDVER